MESITVDSKKIKIDINWNIDNIAYITDTA